MKGRKRFQWYGIVLLTFCLTACEVKRPKDVLPDDKMKNVLYDYHIAKAMGEDVSYNENYKRLLYVESVFKKYGITQAVFDSTMAWYARNPETFAKIYEKVNLRLKAERDGINHLIAMRDNKPKESLPGDSIDVWAWQRIYQLTGTPLNNKITFTLPADTNFYNRDTLRWSVHFRFHNGMPDSAHAPLMAMQILYEKDSIISSLQRVKKAGVETLGLSADTLGKIKEVRGFIYYPTQKTSQTFLVDRISLMRYHAKDSLIITPKDSIKQDTVKVKKDSVGASEEVKSQVQEVNPDAIRKNLRPRPTMGKPTRNAGKKE